jgi:hypothetical protein
MRSQVKQIRMSQIMEDFVLMMYDLQMYAQNLRCCDDLCPASLGLVVLAFLAMDVVYTVSERGQNGLPDTGVIGINADTHRRLVAQVCRTVWRAAIGAAVVMLECQCVKSINLLVSV